MKRIVITILIVALFLTGCSAGVSKEEYDELQEKYSNLLEASSILPLLDVSQGNDSFISKWGSTMFDDATTYAIDNNTSGLITTLDKIGETSIDIFISMVMINLRTMPVLISDNDPRLMYIKAVNKDELPIMEIFIDASDLGNIKTDFLASNDYIEMVNNSIESLNSALNE